MNLKDQAKKMRMMLDQTGETQTGQWETLEIILRRDEEKMQLVAISWARQANRDTERPALVRTFNIPAAAKIDYDYQQGWGIVKWTWTVDQPIPQTIDLNQAVPPAARQLSWLALADHLEQRGQRLVSVAWPDGESKPVIVVEDARN